MKYVLLDELIGSCNAKFSGGSGAIEKVHSVHVQIHVLYIHHCILYRHNMYINWNSRYIYVANLDIIYQMV